MLKNTEIYHNELMLENKVASQVYEFKDVINSEINEQNTNSLEHQSNELNCFTSIQLAKIQGENFKTMKNDMFDIFDNDLECAKCDNCQIIGRKDHFIGNFCCKVCKEKYHERYEFKLKL